MADEIINTPSAADAAASGPTGSFEQPTAADAPDIEAVLRFSPSFDEPAAQDAGADAGKGGDTPPAGNTTGATADGGSKDATAGQPAQPAAQPATAQPNAPASDSSEGQLTPEQLALLTTMKDHILVDANQPAEPAAKPDATPAKPDGKAPEGRDYRQLYTFNLPDELMAAINSEDPKERKGAMQYMISGVGAAIHKQVEQEFTKTIEALTTRMPQFIQQAVIEREQARAVFDDFYGTYKQFNRPELYPLVTNVAKAVMKEKKLTQWGPEARDAVAARLNQLMGANAAAAPAAPAKPATQPAMFGGSNARPAASPKTVQDDIAETLGF